ncbi:387_t:CDS:2 [Entrophospora sp. SA101]|nr:387_t:CDS:2 [Entrophospora sp. SA101]
MELLTKCEQFCMRNCIYESSVEFRMVHVTYKHQKWSPDFKSL